MVKNSNIKAILHDWDDTVTNSFITYSKWYAEFADMYKLPIPTKEQIKQNWGNTVPVMINLIWNVPLTEAEKMLYTFNPKNTYYPRAHNGGVETLNNFKRQGYKLAIIVSSSKFKLN